jgi:CheY-like chemotaxis protein
MPPSLQQIVAYIKQYQSKFSIEALRAQLLKQNVPPATFEEALRVATGAPPQTAPPQPAQPAPAQPAQPPQAAPAQPSADKTQPLDPAMLANVAKGGPMPKPTGSVPAGYVAPKAPPVPPPKMSFVLVVDDDPLIRDMLVEKLETAKYKVTCAEDAAQSVIQAEGMRISILISDIEMPGFGSGVDAVKKLRANRSVPRNLPVIFVTGMPPAEAKKIVPTNDPYIRLMHKPVDWRLMQLYIRDLTGVDRSLE